MSVYFDNAATTPLDPQVLEAMMPYLTNEFGNPSSTHQFGRRSKAGIEKVRRSIAQNLNCAPAEIIFTSGGTEADNLAIYCGLYDMGIKHFITSPIEHKAVLSTLEAYASKGLIKLSLVKLTHNGHIDIRDLENLLDQAGERSFVSLMQANNEIGNLIDLHQIGEICKKYNAIFHSDTVQTMGHYPFDLQQLNVDFITASAHKFHGPKGIGFLYARRSTPVQAMIVGGGQERNHRGGTENLYGIIGLGKALELAVTHMQEHREHITEVKNYMKNQLLEIFPGVEVNGCSERSLYTVLNVRFPEFEHADMLLFLLDIEGIAVSGGSACSSGANTGSHVLRGVYGNITRPSVRFSFSRYNTKAEVDFAIEKLKKLVAIPVN
jgi:cysteine desulfurase